MATTKLRDAFKRVRGEREVPEKDPIKSEPEPPEPEPVEPPEPEQLPAEPPPTSGQLPAEPAPKPPATSAPPLTHSIHVDLLSPLEDFTLYFESMGKAQDAITGIFDHGYVTRDMRERPNVYEAVCYPAHMIRALSISELEHPVERK